MTRFSLCTPCNKAESFQSYVSRIAALFEHSTAASFCSVIGLKYSDVALGEPNAVDRFEYLSGNEPGSLSPQIVQRVDKANSKIRGNTFHREHFDWNRVCPHCLIEDESTGTGRRGARAYGRLSWLPSYAKVCEIHGTVLARLPEVGYMQKREFTLRLKMPGSEPEQLLSSAVALEPSDLQKYCDRRILAGETTDDWLGKFQVQEVSYLASAIGTTVLGHGLQETKPVQCMRNADQIGFELLSKGKESLRDFIVDTMDRARRRTPRISLLSALGPLGYRLSRFGKSAGFNYAAHIVHQIIQETRPVGTADMFFDKPFVRVKHSIQSAGQEYGLPFSVIRSALEELELLSSRASRDVAAAALFDKTVMARVASGILDSEMVASPSVTRYRSACSGDRTANMGDLTRRYHMAWAVAGRLSVRSEVVTALVDDGYLPQYRRPKYSGAYYEGGDVYKFLNLYISAKEIRNKLLTMDQTFQSFLKTTKLQPAILSKHVGEDFYLRSEFNLTV